MTLPRTKAGLKAIGNRDIYISPSVINLPGELEYILKKPRQMKLFKEEGKRASPKVKQEQSGKPLSRELQPTKEYQEQKPGESMNMSQKSPKNLESQKIRPSQDSGIISNKLKELLREFLRARAIENPELLVPKRERNPHLH